MNIQETKKVAPKGGIKMFIKKLFKPSHTNSPAINTGKVNAKKRQVFKDSKDRTYVKQDGKKVYVKKLFTPKRSSPPMANTRTSSPVIRASSPVIRATSPVINTGKVNSKQRPVFRDSKGRTYVNQDGKKVYVKKLFTPFTPPSPKRSISPRTSSPVDENTGKVNENQHPVFRNSKGRTYAMHGDKKVYVTKLYTPFTPPSPKRSISPRASSPGDENTGKVNENGRRVFKDSEGRTYAMHGDKKVYVTKLFTPFTPPSPKRKRNRSPQPFKGHENILSTIKMGCSTPVGLGQTMGTCWFNSSLNGFILGEATAEMIFDQIKKLRSSEIDALIKDFPTDSCPIALSRKYVYHYFLKIHGGIRKIETKENAAVELMNKLFTPKALSTPIAKGKKGGYPKDAALKILAKVFPNETTGTLLKWKTVCPNSFSKYTMVFRTGPEIKGPPDTQPLVIKTKDGKTKFNLTHMVYGVAYAKLGAHAVSAYVCGGKKYIYDSNSPGRLQVDWSKPESRKQILNYSYAEDFSIVSYALYVRE
jgi:hypothetical protein